MVFPLNVRCTRPCSFPHEDGADAMHTGITDYLNETATAPRTKPCRDPFTSSCNSYRCVTKLIASTMTQIVHTLSCCMQGANTDAIGIAREKPQSSSPSAQMVLLHHLIQAATTPHWLSMRPQTPGCSSHSRSPRESPQPAILIPRPECSHATRATTCC